MSFDAVAWAGRLNKAAGLTQTTKLVLIAVCDQIRRGEDSCPLGKVEIAEFCCLTEGAVKKALRDLELLKFVERVPQIRNDGSHDRNIIRVFMSEPHPGSTNPRRPVAQSPAHGVRGAQQRKEDSTRSNQKKNPPIPPEGEGAPFELALGDLTLATTINEAFRQFWEVYPRRQGANPRAPAGAKFEAAVAGGAYAAAIIKGARNYAAELERTGKLGTVYVATAVVWLNQRRWEDYQIEPPKRFRALVG